MKARHRCCIAHRSARAWLRTAIAVSALVGVSSLRSAEEANAPVAPIPVRELDPAAATQVSYARQIRSILADNCGDCHSEEDRKSGLDASSVAGLIKGGKKAGPAIVPGKPDESALVQYLRGLKKPQMPKGNPPLTEEQLHFIREWILAGAKDDSGIASVEAQPPDSAGADSATNLAVDDPATQRALNALMFSGNNEARFIAQRTLRLGLLPKPPEPPKVRGAVFDPIDQFIVGKWEQASLKEADDPPALCSDAAFLRRVYLDVIGVIPTAAEAQRFLEDTAPDKRVRLVDELLARNEDYAAHWTPFWEEAIGSSNVGIVGGVGSHGNHRAWIFRSFVSNKPFDLMAAELIDPTLPGYRKPDIGNANGRRVVSAYIRNETHLETIQSAANVAQLFMGTEMKCASCHNHFLNKEWSQARFLAFAGMFATNDLEVIRCEKRSGQFVAAKFPFDLPGAPKTMPQPLDERLHRAAQLLVDPANPRFAKAIVNRLWKRYLGLGLFEPQDDFRLDQPPTNPELLAWLADDFMRHGYDLKHSIRLVLTSRTYQLRYDPELEDHFDVNHPQAPRYYRSPSLRRLTAEELLDSIQVAMTQKLDGLRRTYLDKASTSLTRALGRPASRNEISTARSDDVAVVQALELLNGEEFYERIYSGRMVDQVANEKDLAKAIDRVYWATLSRPASADERELASSFLKTAQTAVKPAEEPPVEQVSEAVKKPRNPEREPLGDVLWALFVSPEFQYIR
jgi:mono/diheme cytochrome c family protein